MAKNDKKEEEKMVEVYALTLFTLDFRQDNEREIGIGEMFELEESVALGFEERGLVALPDSVLIVSDEPEKSEKSEEPEKPKKPVDPVKPVDELPEELEIFKPKGDQKKKK